MAKIRPASCYRRHERAYTRKSKYRQKSFVRGIPGSRISMFDMGNSNGEFDYRVSLKSKQRIQIRHNALEAARIAANKVMSSVGRPNYHIKIKTYPHQIIKHKSLATGAGADRFQSGMKKAFGKPVGTAARVKMGQEVMFVRVNKGNIDKAKIALYRAGRKLPCKSEISFEKVGSWLKNKKNIFSGLKN